MNDQWLNIFLDAAMEAALIITIGGCIIAIVLALLLLFLPDFYLAVSQRLNKWVSTRRTLKPMEIPRNQERRIYRHHRLFGLLVSIGAIYTLSYFMLNYDPQYVQHSLQQHVQLQPIMLEWLLDAGSIILMLTNLFVLVIGVVVFIRPSLLKNFEAWSNKWISTRHASRFLDNNYSGIERYTAQHPRLMGGFLLLGGLYVLGMLGIYTI
jgi:hypothetical protein